MDGATQKVVPESLHTRVINHEHYSIVVGHTEQCQMYDSLRREFCWLNSVSYIYREVQLRTGAPRFRTKLNHQKKLELFPPVSPLEFVTLGLSRQFPWIRGDNQFVAIMADTYGKPTRPIAKSRLTATKLSITFFNDCIVSYQSLILWYLIMINNLWANGLLFYAPTMS